MNQDAKISSFIAPTQFTGDEKIPIAYNGGNYAVTIRALLEMVTKASLGIAKVNNTTDAEKPISDAQAVELNKKQNTSEKNQPNGYAGLDANGLIPEWLIPSRFDDVLEIDTFAQLPQTGQAGKIYIIADTPALDQYVWTSQGYARISTDPQALAALQLQIAQSIQLSTRWHYPVACSDEGGLLPDAPSLLLTFRSPYRVQLSQIRASLNAAQASGPKITMDVRVNTVSIFSTLLSIDNAATTSVGATVPAVLTTAEIAEDAEVAIYLSAAGAPSATGLKLLFLGTILPTA